ncbi:cysteine-rich receptor-like protein kinase 8 [Tanacetum coccineum]|uniref:Cysteine-rich receptor-like protein kinase 8 n=1 Tax=Tanacetum coccineum TaxID=301880 RepID=A0ABQ5HR22_9ASTR
MAGNSTNTNTTENDEISSNHPLFLHQIDHPSLLLISKKLTGLDNYSSWKRSIMIALNAKNKMKLVNGEFPEPTMESNLRTIWERNNDMLISWILNTIDGHRIFQLSHDMVQLNQEHCSIEVYYHKFKGFWDEYDALEAPYMCTCVCNYNNGRINGERDQRKLLIQFLMGLDESYSNFRGQILLMQPLPSAAKAYTMVRQEEKQREGSNPKQATATILNSYLNQSSPSSSYSQRHTPQRQSNQNNNSDKRTKGHYQEECYKIVGYLVGQPLHGNFQPPKINKSNSDNRPRTVNMVMGQEDARSQSSSAAQSSSQNTDGHVSVRIDQLQN